MSDANAENLRAATSVLSSQTLQAFGEAIRDGTADLSLLDPEVTYEDNTMPDHIGEVYQGYAGFLRALKTWAEPFRGNYDPLPRRERTRSQLALGLLGLLALIAASLVGLTAAKVLAIGDPAAKTSAAFERRQPVPQGLLASCAARGLALATRQHAHEPLWRRG
jgi:hypothetical protein